MEADSGNADTYKAGMQEGGQRTPTPIVSKGIGAVPVIGPAALLLAADAVRKYLEPLIAFVAQLRPRHHRTTSSGSSAWPSPPSRWSCSQLGPRTQVAEGVGYKAQTEVITDGDASYKVYFGLIPA